MKKYLTGRDLLISYKESAGLSDASVSIAVGNPIKAVLRPVATKKGSLSKSDVEVLTNWRNKYVKSFLTEFKANKQRTSEWLTDYVCLNDSKILFMIDDNKKRTFGYIGLDNIDWEKRYGEADSVVRGEYAPAGTITTVLHELIKWGYSGLGLIDIGVRVLSDNTALKFYEKAGFVEFKRVPLRKIVEPDMIRWVEDHSYANPARFIVYMMFNKQYLKGY